MQTEAVYFGGIAVLFLPCTFPGVVEDMVVINWGFHNQRGTGWKFTPSPDRSGRIHLHTGSNWIAWSGKSHKDPLTLDLGVSGVKLEKIDFTCE